MQGSQPCTVVALRKRKKCEECEEIPERQRIHSCDKAGVAFYK